MYKLLLRSPRQIHVFFFFYLILSSAHIFTIRQKFRQHNVTILAFLLHLFPNPSHFRFQLDRSVLKRVFFIYTCAYVQTRRNRFADTRTTHLVERNGHGLQIQDGMYIYFCTATTSSGYCIHDFVIHIAIRKHAFICNLTARYGTYRYVYIYIYIYSVCVCVCVCVQFTEISFCPVPAARQICSRLTHRELHRCRVLYLQC